MEAVVVAVAEVEVAAAEAEGLVEAAEVAVAEAEVTVVVEAAEVIPDPDQEAILQVDAHPEACAMRTKVITDTRVTKEPLLKGHTRRDHLSKVVNMQAGKALEKGRKRRIKAAT